MQEPHLPHKLNPLSTHTVTEDSLDYFMYNLTGTSVKPLKITMTVHMDNEELVMEVDTGTSVSIISKETYDRLWPDGKQPPLQELDIILCTYT